MAREPTDKEAMAMGAILVDGAKLLKRVWQEADDVTRDKFVREVAGLIKSATQLINKKLDD